MRDSPPKPDSTSREHSIFRYNAPIGVIMPNFRLPVRTIIYRLPEKSTVPMNNNVVAIPDRFPFGNASIATAWANW